MVRIAPAPSARAKAYVQAHATAQMVDTVLIERPGAPTFNTTTGMVSAHAGTVIYQGIARVYPSQGFTPLPVGDEIIPLQTTLVSIPWDTKGLVNVQRDDMVKVLTDQDSEVVLRWMRVVDSQHEGTIPACRTLVCVDVETSAYTA